MLLIDNNDRYEKKPPENLNRCDSRWSEDSDEGSGPHGFTSIHHTMNMVYIRFKKPETRTGTYLEGGSVAAVQAAAPRHRRRPFWVASFLYVIVNEINFLELKF